MWTKYFDQIFLINLVSRIDRLRTLSDTLKLFDIPFTLVRATENVDGKKGIYQTLLAIFHHALKYKFKRILVFEDDVKFLVDPNKYMPLCIQQLPDFWLQFYLGANLSKSHLVFKYSENLLHTKRALSLHAVAYTKEMMEAIIEMPYQPPIDLAIANWLQPGGKVFCAYPLIATQWPGKSDIENKEMDYTVFIEQRYENVIHELNTR